MTCQWPGITWHSEGL